VPHDPGEPAIPERAQLLLCEYAKLTGTQLSLIGAGLQSMPDADVPWMVAGTLDVRARRAIEGIDLWVESLPAGGEVEGTRGHFAIQGADTAADADPSVTARVPLIVPLPHFDLAEGLYLLRFSIGDVSSELPFFVEETDVIEGEPEQES
jgi:hypothetical protein